GEGRGARRGSKKRCVLGGGGRPPGVLAGPAGSLASPLYPEGGTGPIGSEPLDSLEHRVAPMGKELGAIKHQSDGDLFAGREETYVFSVLLDLRHHGGDAPLDLGTHGPLPRWSRAP